MDKDATAIRLAMDCGKFDSPERLLKQISDEVGESAVEADGRLRRLEAQGKLRLRVSPSRNVLEDSRERLVEAWYAEGPAVHADPVPD